MPTHARSAVRKPARTFPKTRLALAISALLTPALLPFASLAAPVGGNVTSGAANIVYNGAVTDINQSSHKAIINWQGFSTAANETVNFNQPNAASVTLNRVIGNERSVLSGALNANGQVFLLNSNGVLIGKGASINTAGFVASTLGLSDADFNSGHYRFQANGSQGDLINMGTITAKDGAYAALLGKTVSNQGVIVANQGVISLNSGNRITLNFNGDSLLSVTIDEGTLNALVENKQAIQADGGKVILTAKAANELLASQVNNSGIIQAQTLDDLTGSIELYAHGGTANIGGTLDASAPTAGNGGFIETSGDTVNIADGANITTLAQHGKTGNWLIDPTDFTVGSGGDMSGAQLSASLASNNVTIESVNGKQQGEGDIHINDAVAWSANTTLTLDAERDISINNAVTVGGESGGLTLNYGGEYHIRTKASYSGAVLDANGKPVAKQDTSGGIYGSVTFTNEKNKYGLTINGDTYTLLHNMDDLAGISGVNGHYALARNLEGGTHTKAAVGILDGTFTGLGHVVNELTIDAPDSEKVALIGESLQNSLIRDLGVTNINITGKSEVGALIGKNAADLSHVYSSGTITAPRSVGGLFGRQTLNFGNRTNLIKISVSDSFSTVNINTGFQAGGIAGWARNIVVSNTHATGNIIGTGYVESLGGLIGVAPDAEITRSYALGNIVGSNDSSSLGGLLGSANPLKLVVDSFASGDVTGGFRLGGLIGDATAHRDGLRISNSHATGNVTGSPSRLLNVQGIGGLIGMVSHGAAFTVIDSASATGNVTSNGNVGYLGGLVGRFAGNISANSVIKKSWASGNVSGTVLNNPSQTDMAGGLVGALSDASIIDSYATGNVAGRDRVGGLVGQADISIGSVQSIENSYATGTVSGVRSFGSLAAAVHGMRVYNNYWKTQEGQDGFGFLSSSAVVNNSLGLDFSQLPDIQFYADGTIGDVLAARTVALQVRMDTAGKQVGVLARTQQNTANTLPHVLPASTSPDPALVGQIVFSDTPQISFSADIENIDADSTLFDLNTQH